MGTIYRTATLAGEEYNKYSGKGRMSDIAGPSSAPDRGSSSTPKHPPLHKAVGSWHQAKDTSGKAGVARFTSDTNPLFWAQAQGIEIIGLDVGDHEQIIPAKRHALDVSLEGETSRFAVDSIASPNHRPRSFSLLSSGADRRLQTVRSGRSLRVVFSNDFASQVGISTELLQHPLWHLSDSALMGAAVISFEHLLRSEADATPEEIGALALAMLVRLAHFKPGQTQPAGQKGAIDRALTYIEANLSTSLPITRVAEEAGSSPYHFCRIFRAAMNVSPHQYITMRRVELAKKMIQESDSSLAEIAFASGFGSQSHMTTTFKRLVDYTPGQLRRECVN